MLPVVAGSTHNLRRPLPGGGGSSRLQPAFRHRADGWRRTPGLCATGGTRPHPCRRHAACV